MPVIMPRSPSLSLALICPSFTDTITRQPQRLPALERLMAYGAVSATAPIRDLDAWQCELLTALALTEPQQYPSATLTLTGAGHDLKPGTWLHAELVSQALSANGLTMTLSNNQIPATHDEIDLLVRDHLAAAHMDWQVVKGRSYLRFHTPIDARTVSARQAMLGELREALPAGPDATILRRVMTELQMLLHEKLADPGAPNAVWLWGGGEKSPLPASDLPPMWTNDDFTRGIYSAHAASNCCSALPRQLDAILHQTILNRAGATHMLVVIRDCSLDELEQAWFAPARRALDQGRLQQVDVYLDGWQLRSRRSIVRRLFAPSRPVTEWLT
jgi:hypothetical protein